MVIGYRRHNPNLSIQRSSPLGDLLEYRC
ncbi:hypothetical protein MED222_05040 [Vibrio sp. MED222]|nr:hypothetical protein MED222_05040 [Vibrio sp. MED222]